MQLLYLQSAQGHIHVGRAADEFRYFAQLTATGTVQRKTIEIEVPDGTGSVKTTIPNPLFSYTFQPLPGKELFVSHMFG